MKYYNLKNKEIVNFITENGFIDFHQDVSEDEIIMIQGTKDLVKVSEDVFFKTYIILSDEKTPTLEDIKIGINAAKAINDHTNMLALIFVGKNKDFKVEIREQGINNKLALFNNENQMIVVEENYEDKKEIIYSDGTMSDFVKMFKGKTTNNFEDIKKEVNIIKNKKNQ